MAQIVRVDAQTWRIEEEGVRFFLLTGTRKALLIDSGMKSPDARSIAEGLTDLPLELLNTHADRDHTSGNAAFEKVYMSPAEENNYRRTYPQGEIIPVREGDVIDLGDRPLTVIDIPGHTPGSIAVLDAKNRVLITGDTVQTGNIFMFGPHRDMPKFVQSLAHLGAYADRFDTLFPSHGDCPAEPSLIGKLAEGAEEILSGRSQGTPVELFGQTVMLHKFPYAGFLCPAQK